MRRWNALTTLGQVVVIALVVWVGWMAWNEVWDGALFGLVLVGWVLGWGWR